jgi:hypothetical protein
MPLHIYMILLVVCLLLSLLWHLDWFRLQPFSSRGGVKRGTLHRLVGCRASGSRDPGVR